MSGYEFLQSPRASFGRRSRRPLNIVARNIEHGYDDVLAYFPESDEEDEDSLPESTYASPVDESEGREETTLRRRASVANQSGIKDMINDERDHVSQQPVTEAFAEERKIENSGNYLERALEIARSYMSEEEQQIIHEAEDAPVPSSNSTFKEAEERLMLQSSRKSASRMLENGCSPSNATKDGSMLSPTSTFRKAEESFVVKPSRKSIHIAVEKGRSRASAAQAGSVASPTSSYNNADGSFVVRPSRKSTQNTLEDGCSPASATRGGSIPLPTSSFRKEEGSFAVQPSRKSIHNTLERGYSPAKIGYSPRKTSSKKDWVDDERAIGLKGKGKRSDIVNSRRDVAVTTDDLPFDIEIARSVRKKSAGDSEHQTRYVLVERAQPQQRRKKMMKKRDDQYRRQLVASAAANGMSSSEDEPMNYRKRACKVPWRGGHSKSKRSQVSKNGERAGEQPERTKGKSNSHDQATIVEKGKRTKQRRKGPSRPEPVEDQMEYTGGEEGRKSVRKEKDKRVSGKQKLVGEKQNFSSEKRNIVSERRTLVNRRSETVVKEADSTSRKRPNRHMSSDENENEQPKKARFNRLENEHSVSFQFEENAFDEHSGTEEIPVVENLMPNVISHTSMQRSSSVRKSSEKHVKKKRKRTPKLTYENRTRSNQSKKKDGNKYSPGSLKRTTEGEKHHSENVGKESEHVFETPKSRTSWVGPSPMPYVPSPIPYVPSPVPYVPNGDHSFHLSESRQRSSQRSSSQREKRQMSFSPPAAIETVNTLPGRSDPDSYAEGSETKSSKMQTSQLSSKPVKRKRNRRIVYRPTSVRSKPKPIDVEVSSTKHDQTKLTAKKEKKAANKEKSNIETKNEKKTNEKKKSQKKSLLKQEKLYSNVNSMKLVKGVNDELIEMNVVFTPAMLNLVHPGNLPDGRQINDVLIHKFFNQPAFSVGIFELLPMAEKGFQFIKYDTVVFQVLRGEIYFAIEDTNDLLGAGCSFYVPPGNAYNIINASEEEEARILFTQIKNV